jgi:hypothetical protein
MIFRQTQLKIIQNRAKTTCILMFFHFICNLQEKLTTNKSQKNDAVKCLVKYQYLKRQPIITKKSDI